MKYTKIEAVNLLCQNSQKPSSENLFSDKWKKDV